MTGDSDIETIVSEQLSKRIDCNKFIVTHGQLGCVTLEKGSGATRIPAFTKTVVDTEIEEAIDNDCDTLVLVCANGWTSGAENAADDEEEVDVYLVYPPDDMRELEAY